MIKILIIVALMIVPLLRDSHQLPLSRLSGK